MDRGGYSVFPSWSSCALFDFRDQELQNPFGWTRAPALAAGKDSSQLRIKTDWGPVSPRRSKWIIPIMTVVSNHIYETVPLWAHIARVLVHTALKGSFHIPESPACGGLFYLRVAVLCWRVCPFSTLFFSSFFFKSISHCSISWVRLDMRGIAARAEKGTEQEEKNWDY